MAEWIIGNAAWIVPTALIVAGAASVAGTGVGVYGLVKQSKDAESQAKAIRDQREFEAGVAQQNADFAERQHRRRISFVRGEQQSLMAAAGIDTTSGTPLVQDIDLATQGELEALMLKRQGSLASSEKMFEAGILGSRARAYRGAVGYQVAGGTLSGISSAAGYGAYALRPTTTQIGTGSQAS